MSWKFNFYPDSELESAAGGRKNHHHDGDAREEEGPDCKKARIVAVDDDGKGGDGKEVLERPFREVSLDDVAACWHDDEVFSIEDYDVLNVGGGRMTLRYVQPSNPVDSVIREFSDMKHRRSDLISGVYEGGMKIWEGAIDLMTHMCQDDVSGKRVMELGCGFGLPGLLAHRLGARQVHFQDYNDSVLLKVTAPSALLQDFEGDGADFADHITTSGARQSSPFRFYSGDWSHLAPSLPAEQRYDVILTAETIYEVGNYSKLHDALARLLEPRGGVVLMAAKSFYFGVGGGVASWCEFVARRGHFVVSEVKEIHDHLVRNIIVMRCRNAD